MFVAEVLLVKCFYTLDLSDDFSGSSPKQCTKVVASIFGIFVFISYPREAAHC